jgi:hypothetical protein
VDHHNLKTWLASVIKTQQRSENSKLWAHLDLEREIKLLTQMFISLMEHPAWVTNQQMAMLTQWLSKSISSPKVSTWVKVLLHQTSPRIQFSLVGNLIKWNQWNCHLNNQPVQNKKKASPLKSWRMMLKSASPKL